MPVIYTKLEEDMYKLSIDACTRKSSRNILARSREYPFENPTESHPCLLNEIPPSSKFAKIN